MREILFRGKTTVKHNSSHAFNNTWVLGNLIHSGDKLYIHPVANKVMVQGELGRLIAMHEVIPETIGQYTGLTDRNGVKIFEGDILDLTHYTVTGGGIVKFGEYKGWGMISDYPCGNVGFYISSVKDQHYIRKDILFFCS